MALPSYPGPISLSRIQTEFGGGAPIALAGEYYAGGGKTPAGLFGYPIVNGLSTKTLIPSGPAGNRISLGNFFGGDVTQFYFIADYMLLTYYFDTGLDLDTRTRLYSPDPSGDYMGWARANSQWSFGDGSFGLKWGGDNTGQGYESILVDVAAIRRNYGNTTLNIELRAQWYREVGYGNVRIDATLYKGGSMIYDNAYSYYNSGYTDTLSLVSGNKAGSDIRGPTYGAEGGGIDADGGVSENGTAVAILVYNTQTGSGTITMS
jgi:hypothetical protein